MFRYTGRNCASSHPTVTRRLFDVMQFREGYAGNDDQDFINKVRLPPSPPRPPTLGAAATAPAAQPTAFPDCSLPVHPLMLRRRRWRVGVDCRVLAAQGLEMLQNEYNALLFLEIPLTRKCAKRSTHGKNPLAHLCGDNC